MKNCIAQDRIELSRTDPDETGYVCTDSDEAGSTSGGDT